MPLPRFVSVCLYRSRIPHVHQIKAKNDQTMLKYGEFQSSLFIQYIISDTPCAFCLVEPPNPMVCEDLAVIPPLFTEYILLR